MPGLLRTGLPGVRVVPAPAADRPLRDLADLPAATGAYALCFGIDAPQRLAIRRLGCPTLAPGFHVRCGSARGPGGIRARVARHLSPLKRRRWHVDRLDPGDCRSVLVWPGGDECRLVRAFAGAAFPVPGFGSSDCGACPAHLATPAAVAAAPCQARAKPR